MNATVLTGNRHHTRRQAALAKLGQLGPLIEGHLASFKRPGCAQPGWHLTYKNEGKTTTVYVPMDLVAEVKTWTQNYRRLKTIVREITRHSLALIRQHGPAQRAARSKKTSTSPKAPKP
jgi:hypothetical protein